MPENKNSFIKSKMNKDLDERLLPNNEYRDASNVAVSRSEGSDVGALESILGNTSVLTAVANSKIIGYYVDETNNFIYYFLTDFDGNLSDRAATTNTCTINRFDINTNNNVVLVSGYFLNFSKQYHMYGISLMENLLFWTDNRNQPRKININIALGDANYYTTEDQISVCKFAPYDAPDFINLRSTAATKPSTMTNQQVIDTVTIGSAQWSDANLDVSTYSNGDTIPEATTTGEWAGYDAASTGAWCWYNFSSAGIQYGKLYNKWAVEDARGLAPLGFKIPAATDFSAIGTALSGTEVGKKLKSVKPWPVGGEGTNTVGFAARPAGQVTAAGVFSGQGAAATSQGNFWQSDASANYQQVVGQGTDKDDLEVITNTAKGFGASVRVIRDNDYQWSGDPELLVDKFVKFSYRFKYDDNEYSVIAPFSQDVFVPEQSGLFNSSDEKDAFRTTVVSFMQNNINNAVLNITLPSKDIITDYKIKEIDIIFKESDGLAYQVLETVDVNQEFIDALNYTNVFQYNYESTLPIRTLPQSETTRVYDKVPVRSLAQESSGNRVIYGNFIQSYSAPLGLNYYVDIDQKSTQTHTEYPNHSVKQNRNYQVGIILADKYGRQTDVVLSNYDNLLNSAGNPQQGSNLFNAYKNSAFTSSVSGWLGDNLKLEFNNMIPEGDNADGVSGFPGSYAEGNYYTTTSAETAGGASVWFWNYSTQTITAADVGGNPQTIFNYVGLLLADADSASNTFNVYVSSGTNGWVKQDPSTYSTSTGAGNSLVVTFTTGITATRLVKAEILFGTEKTYKYRVRNLFTNFYTASVFSKYFAQGKYLRGLDNDYAKITNTLTAPSGPAGFADIYVDHELSTNYLINMPALTRPEPVVTPPQVNATYDINPNGFYTYRVAVKQQQQEYYNVYLPGIVNGYPIEQDASEQNQTGFISLISDNINKVPRNLQEVGPLDDQFNSDTRMWGRVTNITGDNEQYFPNVKSDKVELIGTTTDVFPGKNAGTNAGDINEFAIFEYVSRPNVGKVSTQQSIGLTEDLYTDNSPNPPSNMKLAVYETAPVVSALELFYETSTAGLISDLNYDIINATTEITGSTIEAAAGGFNEDDASGTTITNEFFPTDINGNVTNTTSAILLSVNSKYENGILNPNNRAAEFKLESGSATGSYKIKTASTFYAGEDNATLNFFEFTIQFTQSNGVLVNQSYNVTLGNVAPIITANIAPSAPVAGTDKLIFDSITGGAGPTGTNGSADTCSRFLFPRQTGAGFELSTVTQLNGPGTTSSTTPAYVQSPSKTLVISAANTNIKVGMVVSNNTNTITQGTKVTGVAGTSIALDTTTGGTGALDIPANDTITFSESLTPADYFIIKKQEPKNVSNPCTPSSDVGVNEYGMQVLSAPGYTLVAGQSFQLTFTLKDALGLSTNVNGTISFTVAA